MAVQMRVLQVGQLTLSFEGAKILANASKYSAVSHWRALAQMELLKKQVAELLSKFDAADSAPLEDGLTLPEEAARRQDRLEQLRAASEVIKARAKERYQQEFSQFESKEQDRLERARKTGKKPGGRPLATTPEDPRDKEQFKQCRCRGCGRTTKRSNSRSNKLCGNGVQAPRAHCPRSGAAGGSARTGPRSRRQGENEASS